MKKTLDGGQLVDHLLALSSVCSAGAAPSRRATARSPPAPPTSSATPPASATSCRTSAAAATATSRHWPAVRERACASD